MPAKTDRISVALALLALKKVSETVSSTCLALGMDPATLKGDASDPTEVWNVNDAYRLVPNKVNANWVLLTQRLNRMHGEILEIRGLVEVMKQCSFDFSSTEG